MTKRIGATASVDFFAPPSWGPWVGAPPSKQRLCAVVGCREDGHPQICPFDGRYHHHGCIHYDREHTTFNFRKGWGWLCTTHFDAICAATGHEGYIKTQVVTDDSSATNPLAAQ